MDSVDTSNEGQPADIIGDTIGHWLPHMRPDDLEEKPSKPSQSVSIQSSAAEISTLSPNANIGESLLHRDMDIQHDSQEEKRSLAQINPDQSSFPHSIQQGDMDDLNAPGVTTSETWNIRASQEEEQEHTIKEQIDPAWGLARTDTTQLFASVDRSTTFPSPDPSRPYGDGSQESQTAAFPESSEEIRDDDTDTPVAMNKAFQTEQEIGWPDDEQDLFSADTQDAEDQFQGIMRTSTDRFEEGLPLIEEQTPENTLHQPANEQSMDNPFGTSVEEEEGAFFSQISAPNGNESTSPKLGRKSTGDVLKAMHVSDVPDSPAEESTSKELSSVMESGEELDTQSNKIDAIEADESLWAAVLDDEEFLVEDADDLLPDSDDEELNSTVKQNGVAASLQQNPQSSQSSNPYAPHQPSTSDMTQFSPTTHGNIGVSRLGLGPMNSFQTQVQQRPAAVTQASSFVDQSKGGYKSPYDLPLELSKPKKRAHVPQPIQNTNKAVPPPPRSSSMNAALQPPFTPSEQIFPVSSETPVSQPSPEQSGLRNSPATVPTASSKRSTSSFFEDLQINPRPRAGRYTPQQTRQSSLPAPPMTPRSPPKAPQPIQQSIMPQPQQSIQSSSAISPAAPLPAPTQPDPYAQYQLRAPEPMDPYANVPLQTATAPVAAPATTRYSPAPASLNAIRPGPSPRYSPAPPSTASSTSTNRYASQPIAPPTATPPAVAATSVPPPPVRQVSQSYHGAQSSVNALAFQPRTSSPLAQHKASIDESADVLQPLISSQHEMMMSPPRLRHASGPVGMLPGLSPTKPPMAEAVLAPPRRSQTQSPSQQRPTQAIPRPMEDFVARPASVHGHIPFTQPFAQPNPVPIQQSLSMAPTLPEPDYIVPTDEAQRDPLMRWKGAPVFRFGFGGTVVSTFPRQIPRFSAGAVRPQVKAVPGDIVTRNLKDVMPLPELVASFPGPLRNKSKKKELLSWMNTYINALDHTVLHQDSKTTVDSRKQHEEKVLLWKTLRALVENDGVIDSSAEALKAINMVFAPELHLVDESTATQYRDENVMNGIYRPPGTSIKPDSVDPMAIEALRKFLLRGKREEAVWHAVDNRLWSHAMLIASTLDKAVWKQVVQEFVRQEVKTAGANTESLCALYEIFGGNLAESIDQLVPPSARAGLQMVSRVDSTGPTKNALEGLDRWRETLTLILNNRSQGDFQALTVLGRLLGDYGRVEASHICHLLSRNPAQPIVMGGLDESQAPIVLIGADHRKYPFNITSNQECVLMSEIYEFATLVLGIGAAHTAMPHLAVYKLQRAMALADHGMKAEAQAYCEAIGSTLKSSTKVSPYYHPVLLTELDELFNRLKQVPVQSSGSWITKPSLEKVSGSMWNKFSSFVAGDDSDAESKGSGKDVGEVGPFAKIGGTPSLSRSESQSDLYSAYPAATVPPAPTTIAGSRYAPNGMSSARSSSELTRGRPSLDSQRSPPSTSYAPNRPFPTEPISMLQSFTPSQPTNPYQPNSSSPPSNPYQPHQPTTSYMPVSPISDQVAQISPIAAQDVYMPTAPLPQVSDQGYNPSPPAMADPRPFVNEQPSFGGYQSGQEGPTTQMNSFEPPQAYGYEPPQDSGYVPYIPEPDSDDDAKERKPKKSSYLGDDDDNYNAFSGPAKQVAQEPSSTTQDDAAAAAERKRANDAAAEAAFKAAAEADAAREKDRAAKAKGSGWFGGWLGSKKSEDLTASSKDQPKVYRANLGESKMKLYYDKELGKWVNPDNPDVAKKTATPPPPRLGGTPGPPTNGPPRAPAGPPSGPPSRSITPAGLTGPASALPPSVVASLNAATGPPSSSGSPAPPSRPGTAASSASSIDDLIGPAAGRKTARGKKTAKSGRYVDVMAK